MEISKMSNAEIVAAVKLGIIEFVDVVDELEKNGSETTVILYCWKCKFIAVTDKRLHGTSADAEDLGKCPDCRSSLFVRFPYAPNTYPWPEPGNAIKESSYRVSDWNDFITEAMAKDEDDALSVVVDCYSYELAERLEQMEFGHGDPWYTRSSSVSWCVRKWIEGEIEFGELLQAIPYHPVEPISEDALRETADNAREKGDDVSVNRIMEDIHSICERDWNRRKANAMKYLEEGENQGHDLDWWVIEITQIMGLFASGEGFVCPHCGDIHGGDGNPSFPGVVDDVWPACMHCGAVVCPKSRDARFESVARCTECGKYTFLNDDVIEEQ